jgi:predicted CXXCH cytochrome family protein
MQLIKYIIISILIVTFWTCSAKTQYKYLSFFLDGVPSPQDSTIVEDNRSSVDSSRTKPVLVTTSLRKPTYNLHSPYKDRSCNDCHDSQGSNKLNSNEPDLCYECHDEYKEEFEFLHGPVSSGYCTACHNPHVSENENLLITKKQDICLFCHEKEQVYQNDVHEDVELTECLDCHNPHGGEDRYILN